MADEAVTVRNIDWRELFPFTHLFRAFRVAVHPSKLIIALVALACLWIGGLVLDGIWPTSHRVTAEERAELYAPRRGADTVNQEMIRRLRAVTDDMRLGAPGAPADQPPAHPGIFRTFFNFEVAQAHHVLMFPWSFISPFEAVWRFVADGPLWLWRHHWIFALLYTAWFLLIWSVFGGAIARIAAVHVARDEKISVRHAMGFSAGKVLSFVFAPVIPIFIVLVIGLIIAVPSWILFHIPLFGPPIAGVTTGLALLGGFIITLVLLGTIGGFNLMYPTVAVEGSDSFDAISRSFSYVFARPWRMLWYTLVAVVYGAICYLFVRFFVWMVLVATYFFMSWWLGTPHTPPTGANAADVFARIWQHPDDPLDSLRPNPDYASLNGSQAAAAGMIQFWVYLTIGLIGAFAISFYFSANTIIYYLMRREVDATDLDDVYVEETDDDLEAGDGAADVTVAAAAIAVADEVPAPESPSEPPAGT
jgi:hypothetical protein